MSIRLVALLAFVLARDGLSAPLEQPTPPTSQPELTRAEQSDKQSKDIAVVYGRIKEVRLGQKIVIHVDNARDKTYNLADKDRTIKIAEDLAVGDPVKVLETKSSKAVQIVRDTGGDSSREERSRK